MHFTALYHELLFISLHCTVNCSSLQCTALCGIFCYRGLDVYPEGFLFQEVVQQVEAARQIDTAQDQVRHT